MARVFSIMKARVPCVGVILALLAVGRGVLLARPAEWALPSDRDRKQDSLEALRTIYYEVKELGPYPGEAFIKREFFIGFDDDDTNKDRHVVVLIQTLDGREVMTIQVTFMEKTKADPNIRYAKTSKSLNCQIEPERVVIKSSDYVEADLKDLAFDILKAVRDKKKLLKEYGPVPTCSVRRSAAVYGEDGAGHE